MKPTKTSLFKPGIGTATRLDRVLHGKKIQKHTKNPMGFMTIFDNRAGYS